MRVLVACEFSGVVRDAFRARGHDAVSCDLLPSERPGPHVIGDVRDLFADGWDLLIAHPPCTFLAEQRREASLPRLPPGERRRRRPLGQPRARGGFFLDMLRAPIPRIAVENPIMLGHVRRLFDIPAPSQTIQPWQFGHPETKATCLWLQEPAAADADARRRGPRGAGAPGAARAGPLAEPEPHFRGHRRGDGGPVERELSVGTAALAGGGCTTRHAV